MGKPSRQESASSRRHKLAKGAARQAKHTRLVGPGIQASREEKLVVSAEQQAKNQAAIRLLESWRTGDEQEQRETWEFLKRVLDEDRLSDRPFFPEGSTAPSNRQGGMQ